jgi:hypothetical protein
MSYEKKLHKNNGRGKDFIKLSLVSNTWKQMKVMIKVWHRLVILMKPIPHKNERNVESRCSGRRGQDRDS